MASTDRGNRNEIITWCVVSTGGLLATVVPLTVEWAAMYLHVVGAGVGAGVGLETEI